MHGRSSGGSLLQRVEHEELLQDFGLTCLSDFSRQEHLVHHRVNLIKVEDKVEFTDIVEIFVEDFNKVVDCFEVAQVIVVDVDADAEVEAGIATVHNFEVAELYEVCVFGISDGDDGMHFLYQFLLLVIVKVHVPLGQPRLARSVLDQDKPDHFQ